ncbi:putative ATPase RIL [Fervidicoccus fontis Kam940]|uniref:Putative ATPase RIL n=1 Tax=Fervidicoccus fontis (strain DSM 19380 / JCM 18336 / VKM B-2539 / Kam940) TaxID=1163730 RepID=I0A1F1_FERFK|nr:ribosome biogenesis/translation initiation ATPase RLI [Fervidicoccus fontis]AFH42808.1 putative ATPase RIL [Fervidicoccus fontis Kam940]
MRVAVIDYSLCKPTKCNLECIRFCPVNRSRRSSKAIEIDSNTGKPVIYENVCIGCNICVKKCPYNALEIENLPDELSKLAIHRYGKNGFKLFGLPVPKKGEVLGIIGKNGIGKTTTIRILAGELIPNFGDKERKASENEVLERFRGTELFEYFQKVYSKKIKVAHKIQYVELVPRYLSGKVSTLLEKADERGIAIKLASELGLSPVLERDVKNISGGELQKILIVATLSKKADLYIFDEPSSFLDVRERIRIASLIRELVPKESYSIVIEHDIALLDYLSDNIVVMYGEPGVYGVASKTYSTRSGINHFLDGYLPAENMRIRKEPIRFHVSEAPPQRHGGKSNEIYIEWRDFTISLDGFRLDVKPGSASKGEVIGILGPNGIGKTTFVKKLVSMISEDRPEDEEIKFSYKPQYVSPEIFEKKTVEENLINANPQSLSTGTWAYEDIVRPFGLYKLREREVSELSGGELQKLALAVSLIKDAELYLLDEPSAYLDVEERLSVAKVIRRLTESRSVAAFVVEHDLSIIDYICSRIMVFEGKPGEHGFANSPMELREGMNKFLKILDITFRRDPSTGRPRINKKDSYNDREQKRIGEYYYIPKGEENLSEKP